MITTKTAQYFDMATKATETIINSNKPSHAPVPKNKLSKSASASAFTGQIETPMIRSNMVNSKTLFNFNQAKAKSPESRIPKP